MPKITEMTQDTVVGGAEKIYMVDGSTDKYATINQLKSVLNGHISSLASLKAYEGLADEQLIYLEGGTTVGDEKQGLFRWDAASTATADDEDTVQVTSVTTGRWIRQEGRYATETHMGVVKLASDSETSTGTEDTKAVTPASMMSLFDKVHSTKGSQKFPNGLIVQWGQVAASGAGTETLYETFPTAGLGVIISARGASGAVSCWAKLTDTSTMSYASSNVNADGLQYLAWGY